jgi:hypothetical protein
MAHYSTKKVSDPERPTTVGDLLAIFPAAINGFNAGGKSGSATIGFRVEQAFLTDAVLSFARLTGLEIEVRVYRKQEVQDVLEMAKRDEAGEPDDTPLGELADFVRHVSG